MVEQTLWTSYTPTTTNATDSQEYALGTGFYAVVSGWSLGAKWRFPNTLPTGSVTAKLWRVDGDDTVLGSGVELASATFASPVAGAVNEVRWSVPIVIDANVYYVVSVKTADRYVATTGYDPFDTGSGNGGVVSGDLRAPENSTDPLGTGTLHNGKLNALTGHQFPHQTFSNSNYWVDVIFTTDDPSGGTPSSSDAGTVTDAATLAASATGIDAGTGTQGQVMTASLASSESGTLSQDQTLAATFTNTDTGAGTAGETLTATLSGIDQGAVAEEQTLSGISTSTETGTLSETWSVTVPYASTEAGTGDDDQALTTALPGVDQGTVADGQAVSATGSVAETGSFSETWSVTVSHASSDSGTGSEAEEPPVFMSSDSGTLVETQALTVVLTGSDAANNIETNIRQVEGEAGEIPQYPITIIRRTPGVVIGRDVPGMSIHRESPGITIRG